MNRLKRLNIAVSLFVAALFVSALFSRCASIGTPNGGPVDSLPPVILRMEPENYTTNIDPYTKKIYIEFDEFVKLADQQTQFFSSPAMKNKPQILTRGRGVVVTLRDTLKENTTYALNFGSSIQDNNEGNPLVAMRYVFSTGDTIDSLALSGYTEDGYSADSVSSTLVMFYPVDSVDITPTYDSTLFNSTPAAMARAEKNGTFFAQNLKPIPYHIYAIEDTNGNFTYEPGTDQVGFLDRTYNPAEMEEFGIYYDSLRKYIVAEPQVHFRMFLDEPFQRQQLVGSERPLQHKAMLYFGASHPRVDSIIIDSIAADQIMVEYFSDRRDTVALWFNAPAEQLGDTLRGRLVYHKHDSLNRLVPTSDKLNLTWRYIESREEKQERERQERERKKAEESGEEWTEPEKENPFELKFNVANEVNPEKGVYFDLKYPVKSLDTAAITLQYLSPQAVAMRAKMQGESEGDATANMRGAAQPIRITRDTMNLLRWNLATIWGDVGGEYYLTIPKGAITDIAGFANDSITKELTMLDPDKFGTLVVDVAADDNGSEYILELLNGAGSSVIDRKVGVRSGRVLFKYIPVGDVMLRVVEDRNGNGEWDAGDLVKRRQSELVKSFKSDEGEIQIEMRANWEIEVTVDTKKLFAPESQAELVERLEAEERARLKKIADDRAKNRLERN